MDEIFSGFLSDSTFFTKHFLLSIEANCLLRRILVVDPNSRMSLAGIRREVAKITTFFLTEEEIGCRECLSSHRSPQWLELNMTSTARAGRRHWLYTGLSSSPSSPSLSPSDPDEQYVYSPPNAEFDPVVISSSNSRSSLASLPSFTTTEAPTEEISGLPATSGEPDPLVSAYQIFAGPAPIPTSTFSPTRPPLRHFAATSASVVAEDDKDDGLLTAEPYRARGYSFSTSSGSRTNSDGSGSSSPSSERCITPEDELAEYTAQVYVKARLPPIDTDDETDDAEHARGKQEEPEVCSTVDACESEMAEDRTCAGGIVDIQEHDSFAPPVAPMPSPRFPSHGERWGCEHHDPDMAGTGGMTPTMATSHVLQYAVQMLHVFPPEPVRRWM